MEKQTEDKPQIIKTWKKNGVLENRRPMKKQNAIEFNKVRCVRQCQRIGDIPRAGHGV